jgi:hypothetical protein
MYEALRWRVRSRLRSSWNSTMEDFVILGAFVGHAIFADLCLVMFVMNTRRDRELVSSAGRSRCLLKRTTGGGR